mmetsp:Transcript_21477/g.73518  ORF Transcript_21477/g.73518 Transcript_21477/m.73518 type:complete len:350 (-) Transcript_21477:1065-2114(-)
MPSPIRSWFGLADREAPARLLLKSTATTSAERAFAANLDAGERGTDLLMAGEPGPRAASQRSSPRRSAEERGSETRALGALAQIGARGLSSASGRLDSFLPAAPASWGLPVPKQDRSAKVAAWFFATEASNVGDGGACAVTTPSDASGWVFALAILSMFSNSASNSAISCARACARGDSTGASSGFGAEAVGPMSDTNPAPPGRPCSSTLGTLGPAVARPRAAGDSPRASADKPGRAVEPSPTSVSPAATSSAATGVLASRGDRSGPSSEADSPRAASIKPCKAAFAPGCFAAAGSTSGASSTLAPASAADLQLAGSARSSATLGSRALNRGSTRPRANAQLPSASSRD